MRETPNFQLLIATSNPGKIKELRELLAGLPVELKSLDEFPHITEVEETGATFAENAILKAQGYAKQTKIWALADDSGLEVEALNNAPGVFSARYAGANANDAAKIAKLLGELDSVKNIENRAARFVCAVAIADASGAIKFQADGICTGKIAFESAGTHGFGYDPIFIPAGFAQTFGELDGEIKQTMSHRARALAKVINYLSNFRTPPT